MLLRACDILRRLNLSLARVHLIVYMNPKQLVPQESRHDLSGSWVRKLTKNMRLYGFDPHYPISGVIGQDGRALISDGHHRVQAAIAAGISSVPVDLDTTTGENDG